MTVRIHAFVFFPFVLFALLSSVLLWSGRAAAERELIVPFEEGGHLVLDQLSGLRMSSDDGMSYSGAAGVAFRSTKVDALAPGASSREAKTTSLWLAPSFDVFVTDRLSLGALVAVEHSWGAVASDGQRLELPDTTSMTFLPRAGFYVPFGDRLGLWPRVGVGYTSVESVSFSGAAGVPVRDTLRAMMLDLDLSVVYRFGETFFMRGGPEVGSTLGSGTSVWQISGVMGFGMNVEL
jgi:hypothetical protein